MSCCQIFWLAPNSSYNTVGYCLVWKKKNYLRLIIKNIFDHHIDMNGKGVLCWMNHSRWQNSKQQKDILLILLKLPQKSQFVAEHIAGEPWNWGAKVEIEEPRQRPAWRGRPWTQADITGLVSRCHISDWAPQHQRLEVCPCFKLRHRCCCNPVTAGAQELGTGLGMGLRTRALPSVSHKGIMPQVWLKR